MQAYTEEQRKALIGRLNQIAEKLKWHNAAYAQDVLLAVDALNATEPQPVKLPKSERLDGNGYGYYFDMNDVFVALDEAGVKYQVEEMR
ncbi:MAG TPA: hypothetical protein DHT39_10480 [Pantoea sp.]|nr:hypothetical protein [Pantoea sp.]